MTASHVLMLIVSACMLGVPVSAVNQGGSPSRLHLYPQDEWYYNHVPANIAEEALPEELDWCSFNGSSWCTASWNQHIPQYCGSCWAHGTLSMIQDRLKVQKLRSGQVTPDVMLGRQTLLNCAGYHGLGDGCGGGEPLEVFKYMKDYGLPDEGCMPYSATDHHKWDDVKGEDGKNLTSCPAIGRCTNCMPDGKGDYKCWAVETPIIYKLSAYGKLPAGEAAMKAEIAARGPIVCGIACPDDFTYHYHSSRADGVYIDKSGDTEVDHDIEVVGWGAEPDGTKYWVVRNSWGTYWGNLGFFKIERGVNALQIEAGDCWYAVPEHSQEDAVISGQLEGSMDGVRVPKRPSSSGEAATVMQQQAGVRRMAPGGALASS